MISPRLIAMTVFVALSASVASGQAPAKPRPRKVSIIYKAKGGGLAKADGTWTPPAKPGMSTGSPVATPNAAGGYAKVVPTVITGANGYSVVGFNAYDAGGKLVACTNFSNCGPQGGQIGDGTYDINMTGGGLMTGRGIGIMQFSVGP